MSHDSKILIADLLLPEQVTPNDLTLASFDITMFNMGGKQRTEACFRRVLEDAGCELVKVWKSDSGFGVIVEARLKGTKERVTDGPLETATPAAPVTHEPADQVTEKSEATNGHSDPAHPATNGDTNGTTTGVNGQHVQGEPTKGEELSKEQSHVEQQLLTIVRDEDKPATTDGDHVDCKTNSAQLAHTSLPDAGLQDAIPSSTSKEEPVRTATPDVAERAAPTASAESASEATTEDKERASAADTKEQRVESDLQPAAEATETRDLNKLHGE
jgi:hypothetical protein